MTHFWLRGFRNTRGPTCFWTTRKCRNASLFSFALGQPSSPFLQLGRPSSLWLTVAHFSSPQLGPARPSCLSSVQLAPARSSYPDTAHIPSSSARYGRKRAVRRRCSIGFEGVPITNPSKTNATAPSDHPFSTVPCRQRSCTLVPRGPPYGLQVPAYTPPNIPKS